MSGIGPVEPGEGTHALDTQRCAHSNGVGDIDLVTTQFQIAPCNLDDCGGIDLALVGAAKRAADTPAQTQARGLDGLGHGLEAGNRFRNTAVDVRL